MVTVMLWALGTIVGGIILSVLLDAYLAWEKSRPDSELEKKIDSARRMAELKGESPKYEDAGGK